MRCEIRLDQIAECTEIGRFLGDADIDIAGDGFAMDRLQAVFGRLEVRADLTREKQTPVQFIGPLVIRADELCGGSLFSRANARNSTGAARSAPKAPGTGVPSGRPIQTPMTFAPSKPIAQASRWP